MLDSHPTEARLLAYAMIACALILIGRVVQLVVDGTADMTARVIEQTVSLMFFLPLVYYGLAALGTLIARAFGAPGNWFAGRAAFFWASLVAAPLLVASTLASRMIPGAGGLLVAQIGPVFFAWSLANCFAEAFEFKRVWIVLAVIVVPIVLPLLTIWAIRS